MAYDNLVAAAVISIMVKHCFQLGEVPTHGLVKDYVAAIGTMAYEQTSCCVWMGGMVVSFQNKSEIPPGVPLG